MIPNPFWQFHPDNVQNWAYVDNLFTPEECAQIIELGNSRLVEAKTVGRIEGIRESRVAWLYPNDVEFAYRRVTDATTSVNSQFFNFDLFGLAEGFQFTRYDAPTGHYGMHIDKMVGGGVRKRSRTIQWSSPEDYECGEFLLQFGSEPYIIAKEKCKMILFPSYVLHEVRPITKGTRYSLVAWVSGKPFK